jgi:hypothetical protein
VKTKGLAGTTWIGVTVRNAGRRCTLGGSVSFLIKRGGFRSGVRYNPLKIPVSGGLGPKRSRLVKADWSNWCGRRVGFALTVGYAGKTRHSGFAALPRCLDRTSPSQIVKIY